MGETRITHPSVYTVYRRRRLLARLGVAGLLALASLFVAAPTQAETTRCTTTTRLVVINGQVVTNEHSSTCSEGVGEVDLSWLFDEEDWLGLVPQLDFWPRR